MAGFHAHALGGGGGGGGNRQSQGGTKYSGNYNGPGGPLSEGDQIFRDKPSEIFPSNAWRVQLFPKIAREFM